MKGLRKNKVNTKVVINLVSHKKMETVTSVRTDNSRITNKGSTKYLDGRHKFHHNACQLRQLWRSIQISTKTMFSKIFSKQTFYHFHKYGNRRYISFAHHATLHVCYVRCCAELCAAIEAIWAASLDNLYYCLCFARKSISQLRFIFGYQLDIIRRNRFKYYMVYLHYFTIIKCKTFVS